MIDAKTKRIRGLIREMKKAVEDIVPAGVKNGEICENLLYPLMVVFYVSSSLVSIAREQNPDLKDTIDWLTDKG